MKIDQIIRTRRKTIALIVDSYGRLIVRAPLAASDARIRAIVAQKIGWIEKKQQQALLRPPQTEADRFQEGSSFFYLGRPYPLAVVERRRPLLSLSDRFELARPALPDARRVFEGWYRQQARRVLPGRVAELARRFGFQYSRLSITGARTRWGSCGARASLNFSWRLLMAPEASIDYVIVHELAHLRIRNHSRAFWELVEQLMPDYRPARSWLKQNGTRIDFTSNYI